MILPPPSICRSASLSVRQSVRRPARSRERRLSTCLSVRPVCPSDRPAQLDLALCFAAHCSKSRSTTPMRIVLMAAKLGSDFLFCMDATHRFQSAVRGVIFAQRLRQAADQSRSISMPFHERWESEGSAWGSLPSGEAGA
jgi:hypothetical protein